MENFIGRYTDLCNECRRAIENIFGDLHIDEIVFEEPIRVQMYDYGSDDTFPVDIIKVSYDEISLTFFEDESEDADEWRVGDLYESASLIYIHDKILEFVKEGYKAY